MSLTSAEFWATLDAHPELKQLAMRDKKFASRLYQWTRREAEKAIQSKAKVSLPPEVIGQFGGMVVALKGMFTAQIELDQELRNLAEVYDRQAEQRKLAKTLERWP